MVHFNLLVGTKVKMIRLQSGVRSISQFRQAVEAGHSPKAGSQELLRTGVGAKKSCDDRQKTCCQQNVDCETKNENKSFMHTELVYNHVGRHVEEKPRKDLVIKFEVEVSSRLEEALLQRLLETSWLQKQCMFVCALSSARACCTVLRALVKLLVYVVADAH